VAADFFLLFVFTMRARKVFLTRSCVGAKSGAWALELALNRTNGRSKIRRKERTVAMCCAQLEFYEPTLRAMPVPFRDGWRACGTAVRGRPAPNLMSESKGFRRIGPRPRVLPAQFFSSG